MKKFDEDIVVRCIMNSNKVGTFLVRFSKYDIIRIINALHNTSLSYDTGYLFHYLGVYFLVIESKVRIFCYIVYVVHFNDDRMPEVEQHIITDQNYSEQLYKRLQETEKLCLCCF